MGPSIACRLPPPKSPPFSDLVLSVNNVIVDESVDDDIAAANSPTKVPMVTPRSLYGYHAVCPKGHAGGLEKVYQWAGRQTAPGSGMEHAFHDGVTVHVNVEGCAELPFDGALRYSQRAVLRPNPRADRSSLRISAHKRLARWSPALPVKTLREQARAPRF